MELIPKSIQKKLTPSEVEKINKLIRGDEEFKCTERTGSVIRFLLSLFHGTTKQQGMAATKIKSILGEGRKEKAFKHDELLSAIAIADRAIDDTGFFYNTRPSPDVMANTIEAWVNGGSMRKNYMEYLSRIEDKVVKDASNRFKRPKIAEHFRLFQKMPNKEKVMARLDDVISATRAEHGDKYVKINKKRIIEDFFIGKRIYTPLPVEVDGERVEVNYER